MTNITFKTSHNRRPYVMVIASMEHDPYNRYEVLEFYCNNRDRTPCSNFGDMTLDSDSHITSVTVYQNAIATDGTLLLKGKQKTYSLRFPYSISWETPNKNSVMEIQLVFENNFLDLKRKYLDDSVSEYLRDMKDIDWLKRQVYTFFDKAAEEYSRTQLGGDPFIGYFSSSDLHHAEIGILETYEVDDYGTTLDDIFCFRTSQYVCTVTDISCDNKEVQQFFFVASSPERAFLHFKGLKALEPYWKADPRYEIEIIARIYTRKILS